MDQETRWLTRYNEIKTLIEDFCVQNCKASINNWFLNRNKTAHNTVSYMKDVLTLNTLADKGYVYKNYFFRFAILILIDEVFMRMFKRYRELGMKMI